MHPRTTQPFQPIPFGSIQASEPFSNSRAFGKHVGDLSDVELVACAFMRGRSGVLLLSDESFFCGCGSGLVVGFRGGLADWQGRGRRDGLSRYGVVQDGREKMVVQSY